MSETTRFAPSPTGRLHLGHAFAALTAARLADGGRFLVRIEDLDTQRCRPEFIKGILDDLAWLGLAWEQPVLLQSDRRAAHAEALARLAAMGLTYPCRCTRGDIAAALSAPQGGVSGPDRPVYPGTCRHRRGEAAGPGEAIRLDIGRALAMTGPVAFEETGPEAPGRVVTAVDDLHAGTGDIVLARRDDHAAAYHLAVVVDDAFQRVTLVTRGADLLPATPVQRLLQQLLSLPEPRYHHHRLITDDQGRRLAKRDDARALASFRAQGLGPADIRAMLGIA